MRITVVEPRAQGQGAESPRWPHLWSVAGDGGQETRDGGMEGGKPGMSDSLENKQQMLKTARGGGREMTRGCGHKGDARCCQSWVLVPPLVNIKQTNELSLSLFSRK